MSKVLFVKECKSNYKIILLFMGVLTMYTSMIISMFDPKAGDLLSIMAESMPEVFSAFGMSGVSATLIEFIANYLYGFILLVFPMIFVLLMSNRLVSRYLDKGSMAYLLATPNTRRKIIMTQCVFLMIGIFLLVLYVNGLGIGLSSLFFPNSLDITKFIILNVGLLGLLLFMGSVCFLCSCGFQDARRATGISSAFIIASILIQMVSQVGDKFEFMKYITPLTLFDAKAIVTGSSLIGVTCLFVMAIIIFAISIKVFIKKDLFL